MISICNFNKEIKKRNVLCDINYTFESGKIYGLYGVNGSGKTMLLRALAGLIKPNTGEIRYEDKILHKDFSFPPNIGLIIENMELLPNYDAFDNLKILAQINNVTDESDINRALERVGLEGVANLKVKKYSLGMRQRLNIAQAIMESPQYILLDEPTNALDEEGCERIYCILREEKAKGKTIILASHNKNDLNDLCDITLKMSEGKLINEDQ